MKRLGYLERFAIAARWHLSGKEAEEVVDDYRHILRDMAGDEEAVGAFGPPREAAFALADKERFGRWQLVFGILCGLVFLPLAVNVLLVEFQYLNYELLTNSLVGGALLFAGILLLKKASFPKPVSVGLGLVLGAAAFLCLLFDISNLLGLPALQSFHVFGAAAVLGTACFGFGRMKSRKMKGSLMIALVLAFLSAGCVYGLTMYSVHSNIYLFANYMGLVRGIATVGVILFAVLAVAGLVFARMFDRRWRTVYVLALCGLLMCMSLREICLRVPADSLVSAFAGERFQFILLMIRHWFTLYFCSGSVLALVGLL